jgi:hypothetical protein
MKKLIAISVLFLFFVSVFLIHSCKKDQPKVPVVSTSAITEISQISAVSGGKLIDAGSSSVVANGVCWNTTEEPTLADNKTIDSSGIVLFVSKLTQLTANTIYYVRAYALSSAGIGYGDQVSFTSSEVAVPALLTADVTLISATSAVSGGNITTDNGEAVTARGVCYNTLPTPTITNSKTTMCPGNGPFTCSILGLTPGTTYFIRAYATNSVGTSYGNELSFKTLATLPTISSVFATLITQTTAISGGNIIGDGGAAITKRGVCWSKTGNSSIADSKTEDGSGTGVYTSTITGLSPSTSYYVRAYAMNSVGAVYGNDLSFTTTAATLPLITTTAVSSVSGTTATSGGNVTTDGGLAVTARGICWSTSVNPTIANTKTSDGSGTGSFTSLLTGLTGGTVYYVRGYATNSMGTVYGIQISFTSVASITTDGLVAYYPFSGNANDESPNVNNGIVAGAILTTDRYGIANKAYSFNGTSDFIKIPGALPVTNLFTISFWAYSENASGYSNILCDGSSNIGGNDFLINFRGNSIGIRADKNAPLNYEDSSPAELQNLDLLNKWVNIVWLMTPTYSKVYLNGVELLTINEAGSDEGSHDPFSYIGARNVWDIPDNFFKGKLDEIRIYNRALSNAEIQTLYSF